MLDKNDITRRIESCILRMCISEGCMVTIGQIDLGMDAIYIGGIEGRGNKISSPVQHGAQDKRCESKKEYLKYVKKQWALGLVEKSHFCTYKIDKLKLQGLAKKNR